MEYAYCLLSLLDQCVRRISEMVPVLWAGIDVRRSKHLYRRPSLFISKAWSMVVAVITHSHGVRPQVNGYNIDELGKH
jgi:hypothetical protein